MINAAVRLERKEKKNREEKRKRNEKRRLSIFEFFKYDGKRNISNFYVHEINNTS